MITAFIYSEKFDVTTINCFEIVGHANYAEGGKDDIVCAAVSAITQTAYLGLDIFSRKNMLLMQQEPGFFAVKSHEKCLSAQEQAIYITAFYGLMEIAKQYPYNVAVVRRYSLNHGDRIERLVAGGATEKYFAPPKVCDKS